MFWLERVEMIFGIEMFKSDFYSHTVLHWYVISTTFLTV